MFRGTKKVFNPESRPKAVAGGYCCPPYHRGLCTGRHFRVGAEFSFFHEDYGFIRKCHVCPQRINQDTGFTGTAVMFRVDGGFIASSFR